MKNTKFKSKLSLIEYFLKGSLKYFIIAVIFVCLLVLFDLVNPKIIGYTVDFIIDDMDSIPTYVIDVVNSIGGREYLLSHLYLAAIFVVGVALVGAIFRYLFRLFNAIGAEKLSKTMRDSLYDQIIHLPFSWQDANRTGDIIQRCTSDVDMIKNFISEQMTGLFRTIVLIILALIFMFRIHPLLSIVALVFIPIVIGYSYIFHDKIGESFFKVDTEEGRLSSIVQENLTGIRVVRAFGREKYERDRFTTKNEYYTGLWVHMMKILSTFWITNDFMAGIEVIIILALGSIFTIDGQMSPGDFVAFLSFNALLTWPVRELGRTVSEMSKAGISVDRLLYIMNSELETDSMDAVDFPKEDHTIRFEHVSFRYPALPLEDEPSKEASSGAVKDTHDSSSSQAAKDTPLVLENVSFTIPNGATVGILGGTGSGKSTILKLLDNLYDLPDDLGTISIGGTDVRKIKKSALRSNIGMVLQEPYLFSGTIEDNIRIAVDDAIHEDVLSASRTAALDTAVTKFTDGYDTYVGERGVTLSGGQKQRTAIAQTLIRKTPIMIFDDSLSAVDSQTDSRIRQGLKAINADGNNDTTVILVSHRITTIMHADIILVMENGQLKEMGSHDELIARNGIYSHTFSLQSEGSKID